MSEKVKSIKSAGTITLEIVLKLSEIEARALDTISGYGDKAFLEVFYKHLGKHYLEPHEKGVQSLFDTIRKELPQHLRDVDTAREAIAKAIK